MKARAMEASIDKNLAKRARLAVLVDGFQVQSTLTPSANPAP